MHRMSSSNSSAFLLGFIAFGLIVVACGSSSTDDAPTTDAGPFFDANAAPPEQDSGNTNEPFDAGSDAIVDASSDADADAEAGVDTDEDGVPDDVDNCPAWPNPSQSNADGDAKGDACDDETVDSTSALVVPAGSTYALDGTKCYGEIHVFGTLLVKPTVGGGAGNLTLKAPLVIIAATGAVDASAAGPRGGALNFNASHGGLGGLGEGKSCGGGPGGAVGQSGSGGSYGGAGGRASESKVAVLECPVCSDFEAALADDFHCWGKVGATYGTTDGPDIAPGSGGGGAGNSSGCTGAGGPGGNGGGAIAIVGRTMRIDGTVRADGQSAADPVRVSPCTDYRAGGGGGSGGGVLLAALTTFTGAGTLSANGGQGGNGLGDDNSTWAWSGGGGGGGRVKVFAAASTFSGMMTATKGNAGAVPAPPDENNDNLVGTPGSDGTTSSSTTVPAAWSTLLCAP